MSRKSLAIFSYIIIGIILSYYVSILLHEYGHATTAWIFNYKKSPFDILYGSWYLIPVSENVDYLSLFAAGHGVQAALIGISGITVSILLFFICLFCLQQKYIQENPLLLSIFFWLMDMNLMEIFSYIPNRSFIMGDIGEFTQGLNLDPLWVVIPGTALVCLALYCFYNYEVKKIYTLLPIRSLAMQRIILWLTFWPLIFSIIYWEPPMTHQMLSYGANIFSLLILFSIVILFDPKNR